ncbi:MAG: hypothetical protein QGF68_05615 [Nitrospinota bacterium]|nr:hypothetical protein [Nitrospinota bacterium]
MEVTASKLRANRQNALKSTGPKTVNGKAVVRRNGLKHGILAREVVIPAGQGEESQGDFDDLLANLRGCYEPEGFMEEVLVEKIGVCHWRLARVLRCETGFIRTRMDRIGSSMDPDDDEIPGIEAEIAAQSLPNLTKTEILVRYERMLERELYRAMRQLERLQRQRRGEAVPPPIIVGT